MIDNRRVLLVDDDKEVLETYRQVLGGTARRQRRRARSEPPKFELFPVTSGSEAVELVRSETKRGRSFACGVFDMRMPGMDGMETIREVRRLDPNVLCAVCTAYSDRTIDEIDELFSSSEKDHWDYLQKPVSAAELVQKVRCLVSSWNRRRREEYQRGRTASLIAQLSKISSSRPGDVDSCVDLMIEAVRDLTQASRGALLEDGPHGMRVVRSWCADADDGWLEGITKIAQPAHATVDGLVVYPVPSEGIQRTLFISSPAESDHELLSSLGLLLENSARMLNLNAELQIMNESLATQCKALSSARSQAVQAAKLAAIGQVAVGVANDVNGPLGVIHLETEVIAEAANSGEAGTELVKTSAFNIQGQIERIRAVVSEIRDFAQKSPDRREAVPIARAVESAMVILKHRLSTEPVELLFEVSEDLPDALADKIQLIQALVSLLNTALDTSADRPSARVTVRGCVSPDHAGMVRVEVSDAYEDVGERATSVVALRPPQPANRLWMSTVRTIADMHQGVLDFENVENGGTRVWLDLPAASRRNAAINAAPSVLILRSDPARAELTAAALREIGIPHHVAESYGDACERLGRGEADLVLTELGEEGAPVWRLLDDLEQSRSTPPVLVVGRTGHTGSPRELKQLGIAGQVAEPIDVRALKAIILETVRRDDHESAAD